MCFFLAEIHENVPPELRSIIRKSSANYTVDDLLRLTNTIEENLSNSNENPIHLLTQWYSEFNERRKQELLTVLHMNVINKAITHIHFIQNSNSCTIFDDVLHSPQFPVDLLRKKLIIHFNATLEPEQQRLTVNEVLSYASQFIHDGYAVFLNLDIFFDQSLSILQHRPRLDRQVILYLSRYEVDLSISTIGLQCSDQSYVGSHDALIFQPPLKENLVEKLSFEIGTWHMETKIIDELTKANYTVRNACKSIRIWHLHSSQVRHRLMPSTLYFTDEDFKRVMRYPEWL